MAFCVQMYLVLAFLPLLYISLFHEGMLCRILFSIVR